jgi:hypothetical protein
MGSFTVLLAMSQYVACSNLRYRLERVLKLEAHPSHEYSLWIHEWLPGLVHRRAHWRILLSGIVLTRPFSPHMAVAATAAALPCPPWRLGARPSRMLVWAQRHRADNRDVCLFRGRLTDSLRVSSLRAHSGGWEPLLAPCGVTAIAGRSALSLVPVRLYRARVGRGR